MGYTNFLKFFERQCLKPQSHNNLRDFIIAVDLHQSFFDKTVKSHGFLAKGLWKEGKISAIKFLALSCKETT